MRDSGHTYRFISIILILTLFYGELLAQEKKEEQIPLARSHRESHVRLVNDTLMIDTPFVDKAKLDEMVDSVLREKEYTGDGTLERQDSLVVHFPMMADSLMKGIDTKINGRFIPDPKKAFWLAMVIPGGGQIYNRKYWKLPLIYGGFLGCIYAMNWNNTMYRDYSQAYIDIMDSDENTKSYENFLPARYDVTANVERLQEIFRRKKNYYRRYRDLSMFCMIGVYVLSIIDAYVDAEMSSFDISKDLSMKVHPTVIQEKYPTLRAQGAMSQSYGLQCSLNF